MRRQAQTRREYRLFQNALQLIALQRQIDLQRQVFVTHIRLELRQPSSSGILRLAAQIVTFRGTSVLTSFAPAAGGAVVKLDSSNERERTFSINPFAV